MRGCDGGSSISEPMADTAVLGHLEKEREAPGGVRAVAAEKGSTEDTVAGGSAAGDGGRRRKSGGAAKRKPAEQPAETEARTSSARITPAAPAAMAVERDGDAFSPGDAVPPSADAGVPAAAGVIAADQSGEAAAAPTAAAALGAETPEEGVSAAVADAPPPVRAAPVVAGAPPEATSVGAEAADEPSEKGGLVSDAERQRVANSTPGPVAENSNGETSPSDTGVFADGDAEPSVKNTEGRMAEGTEAGAGTGAAEGGVSNTTAGPPAAAIALTERRNSGPAAPPDAAAAPAPLSRPLVPNEGSLLRLFKSDFFDCYLHMYYLFTRPEEGITQYLVNLLYKRTDAEIQFYLAQLCCLCLDRYSQGPSTGLLVRFLLERASRSIHLAIKTSWLFQAFADDPNNDRHALSLQLNQQVEMAAVNSNPEPPGSNCYAAPLQDVPVPDLFERRKVISKLEQTFSHGRRAAPRTPTASLAPAAAPAPAAGPAPAAAAPASGAGVPAAADSGVPAEVARPAAQTTKSPAPTEIPPSSAAALLAPDALQSSSAAAAAGGAEVAPPPAAPPFAEKAPARPKRLDAAAGSAAAVAAETPGGTAVVPPTIGDAAGGCADDAVSADSVAESDGKAAGVAGEDEGAAGGAAGGVAVAGAPGGEIPTIGVASARPPGDSPDKTLGTLPPNLSYVNVAVLDPDGASDGGSIAAAETAAPETAAPEVGAAEIAAEAAAGAAGSGAAAGGAAAAAAAGVAAGAAAGVAAGVAGAAGAAAAAAAGAAGAGPSSSGRMGAVKRRVAAGFVTRQAPARVRGSKVALPSVYCKLGSPWVYSAFKDAALMGEEMQQFIIKQRRCDYFNLLTSYTSHLIETSNLLATEADRSLRLPLLCETLRGLNEWMFCRRCVVAASEGLFTMTGLSLPLREFGLEPDAADDSAAAGGPGGPSLPAAAPPPLRSTQIVRFVPEACKVLSSKKRAPYLLVFEVADLDEDLHRLPQIFRLATEEFARTVAAARTPAGAAAATAVAATAAFAAGGGGSGAGRGSGAGGGSSAGGGSGAGGGSAGGGSAGGGSAGGGSAGGGSAGGAFARSAALGGSTIAAVSGAGDATVDGIAGATGGSADFTADASGAAGAAGITFAPAVSEGAVGGRGAAQAADSALSAGDVAAVGKSCAAGPDSNRAGGTAAGPAAGSAAGFAAGASPSGRRALAEHPRLWNHLYVYNSILRELKERGLFQPPEERPEGAASPRRGGPPHETPLVALRRSMGYRQPAAGAPGAPAAPAAGAPGAAGAAPDAASAAPGDPLSTAATSASSVKFPTLERTPAAEMAANARAVRAKLWGELWQQKKARFRAQSPYGSLRSWNLGCVLVKGGDDVRQEMLASQLIQQFQHMFRAANLPLYLRPYEILVTGASSGIMVFVPDTVSIDMLKRRHGADSIYEVFKAAFADNPAEARRNFIESHAAYSIVGYILQVKDRHNGNYLMDAEGHIIHIDYGFMLSNSPGNVNFEAPGFKLTQEFLGIIGGETSEHFQYFRKLVLAGFLEARKHAERLTLLVEMMLSARMPCFAGGRDVVMNGLKDRLMANLTEQQCSTRVDEIVDYSVNNWRTVQYDAFQRYTNGIL